jgi:hypothetical protein
MDSEIRELSSDELDTVTGGSIFDLLTFVGAAPIVSHLEKLSAQVPGNGQSSITFPSP